jgi:hypothetical protein
MAPRGLRRPRRAGAAVARRHCGHGAGGCGHESQDENPARRPGTSRACRGLTGSGVSRSAGPSRNVDWPVVRLHRKITSSVIWGSRAFGREKLHHDSSRDVTSGSILAATAGPGRRRTGGQIRAGITPPFPGLTCDIIGWSRSGPAPARRAGHRACAGSPEWSRLQISVN